MRHPFLTGKRIYLRGLEEADLDGPYFQWFNDEEVCKFNSHAVFPNTRRRMEEYFQRTQDSRGEVVFAVVLAKGDRHVGNVSLQNIDWIGRSAEFAIIIGDKTVWGKGIGLEAGQLLIDYAFDRLNLRRIYCGTHAENLGMQKLAKALGMKEEGRRKEAMFKNGKYVDLVEYGLIRAD